MFKNFTRTSIRALIKTKGFTLINIFGLALGLSVFLLISFYVYDELSYDAFNVNAKRIYRIDNDIKFGGSLNTFALTPSPMAAAVKNDFPEVEQTCRFKSASNNQVRRGNQFISEPKMAYVDPSIFKIFTLPMIDGDSFSALSEPYDVVISGSVARKYFGKTNVVGEVLTFNDGEQYKVTGVIQDVPKQSHFNYDFFISLQSLDISRDQAWLNNEVNTYVLLRNGSDVRNLQNKLNQFIVRHAGPELENVLHVNYQKFNDNGNYIRISLFPLSKIHLHSNRTGELGINGDNNFVYIFMLIGFFVLLIACVNFMNLSTARSANRAREVGVRKVLGSPRSYLIAQFLLESLIVTAIAAIIAFFVSWAMLPVFNQFSGKEAKLTWQMILITIPFLSFLIIFIALVAGIYPAFVLSGFSPLKVLRGNIPFGFKDTNLRSILVVFQFFVSVFLIIATSVIGNQLKFIRNKDIGFDREQVLIIKNTSSLGQRAIAFKQDVKQLAGVKDVTLSGYLPTGDLRESTSMFQSPGLDQKGSLVLQDWIVDEDYIPTLNMRLEKGRNFSKQIRTDTAAIVINEAAAKSLSIADPIGTFLYVPESGPGGKVRKIQIIGVIKDFNFASLRKNVTPLALQLGYDDNAISIRMKSADLPLLLNQIKAKWAEYSTNQQFDFSFMDDEFNNLYRSEQRIGNLTTVFTSLAIIIACLGLFGLAAFSAEQKKKEIGIRKVLGADVLTITAMLSRQFIKLVLIAVAIATPPAWWAMHVWLQGFAYKQNIGWSVFVLAGLTAITIAFLTVSFQSVKAARANPIKSLKSD